MLVQTELEESAERADVAENQLGKLRAKTRSSVSVSRTSPGVSDRIDFYLTIEIKIVRLFVFFFLLQREIRESTTVRSTSIIRAGSVRQR